MLQRLLAQVAPAPELPDPFECAIRIGALNDDSLVSEIRSILEQLANALGVNAVALLEADTQLAVSCEIEVTQGDSLVSQWLTSLTLTERRDLASALMVEPGRLSRRNVVPASFMADTAFITIAAAQDTFTAAALLFRGATVSVDAVHEQQLVALARLLVSTLARVHTERACRELSLQADRSALAGRAVVKLAHDFNNSLYSIQCVTDVILLDTADPSPLRNHLQEIRKAVARGATLTRHLVTFSGSKRLAKETFDLCEVLTSLGPVLQALLGPQNPLELRTIDQRTTIAVDRSLLEQAILHIVVDAKSRLLTPNPFVVSVQAEDQASQHGTTCPQTAARHHVTLSLGASDCQPSWQPPSNPEFDRLRVALGEFDVQSEVVDQRVVLRFESLARSVAGAAPCPNIARTEARPSNSRTLLIVEDEEISRGAAVHILTRAGYRVLQADCHQKATELLAESASSIDILVTDVVLPDGDGVDLYRRLRRSRPDCCTFFVSGFGRSVLRDYGLSGDNYEFLQKPYSPSKLLQVLRAIG